MPSGWFIVEANNVQKAEIRCNEFRHHLTFISLYSIVVQPHKLTLEDGQMIFFSDLRKSEEVLI